MFDIIVMYITKIKNDDNKMENKQKNFQKEYGIQIPMEETFECRICKKEQVHVLDDMKMEGWGFWEERHCTECGNRGIILHQ